MSTCACMGPQGNDSLCPCAMRAAGKTPTEIWTPEKIKELEEVMTLIFAKEKQYNQENPNK